MTRRFTQTVVTAMMLAIPALGLLPARARAGESGCCNSQGDCCPSCGCCLVPVCKIECAPKKTTNFEYTCKCKWICIPGVTPCCEKCGERHCPDQGCCGHCAVHNVHKLMKYPVPKEECVKKCTVEWACPQCHCRFVEQGETPTAAPAATAAPAKPAEKAQEAPPEPPTAPAPPKSTRLSLRQPGLDS